MQRAGAPDAGETIDSRHAAPQFGTGIGTSPRQFVTWMLSSLAAALLATAAFNLLVDPYGAAGTGIFATGVPRDVSLKADLLRRLDRAPDTIVLGSSRSLKIDPHRIMADTGHSAFNAGVRAGGPPEEYALLRTLHARFPDARPRVVWVLDLEAFRRSGVQPDLVRDAELASYVPHPTKVDAPGFDVWSLFSWSEARDSLSIVRSEINGRLAHLRQHRARRDVGFRNDGYYTPGQNYSWAPTFNEYVGIYRRGFPLRAFPWQYLDRGLEEANSWGARPLVVIAPMHPRLLDALQPLGWDRRHARLLAALTDLAQRRQFDVADMSSIRAFGGTAVAFYDPVHMRPANADRLVDVLAARFPGDI